MHDRATGEREACPGDPERHGADHRRSAVEARGDIPAQHGPCAPEQQQKNGDGDRIGMRQETIDRLQMEPQRQRHAVDREKDEQADCRRANIRKPHHARDVGNISAVEPADAIAQQVRRHANRLAVVPPSRGSASVPLGADRELLGEIANERLTKNRLCIEGPEQQPRLCEAERNRLA